RCSLLWPESRFGLGPGSTLIMEQRQYRPGPLGWLSGKNLIVSVVWPALRERGVRSAIPAPKPNPQTPKTGEAVLGTRQILALAGISPEPGLRNQPLRTRGAGA